MSRQPTRQARRSRRAVVGLAAVASASAASAITFAEPAAAHSLCKTPFGNAGFAEGSACFNVLHHSVSHTYPGSGGQWNGIWDVRAQRAFSQPVTVCNYRGRIDRYYNGNVESRVYSDPFYGCRPTTIMNVERPFPHYGDGADLDQHNHYPSTETDFVLYWTDNWITHPDGTARYAKVATHGT